MSQASSNVRPDQEDVSQTSCNERAHVYLSLSVFVNVSADQSPRIGTLNIFWKEGASACIAVSPSVPHDIEKRVKSEGGPA